MNETAPLEKQDLTSFASALGKALRNIRAEQEVTNDLLGQIADLLVWHFRDDPVDQEALCQILEEQLEDEG